MPGAGDTNWNKTRLGRLLGLFFVALAIPTAVLAWQAYSRLKWESFHQHQVLAEELVGRIDRRLNELIAKEEARTFTDYGFLVVEGAPTANYLQRSPLSGYPVNGDIPGLLGYFQIDAQGRFTTPLLPDQATVSPLAYGIADAEFDARRELHEQLLRILSQERLAATTSAPEWPKSDVREPVEQQFKKEQAPVEAPAPQAASSFALNDKDALVGDADDRMSRDAPREQRRAAPVAEREIRAEAQEQKLAQSVFDRLAEEPLRKRTINKQIAGGSIGRVDDLKLDRPYPQDKSGPRQKAKREPGRQDEKLQNRAARLERSVLPSPAVSTAPLQETTEEADLELSSSPRVHIFESEIDPFEFGRLESGHLVLYRKVWRDNQRYIQGALIETKDLLQGLIEVPFRDTALSAMSRLAIALDGDILSAFGDSQSRRYLSSTEQLAGSLLYRSRLSDPLSRLEMIFSVTNMPSGPGAALITWVAVILALVLSGGLFLMYRLGAKQIELNAQQRDFVSAVSHELKTPLTSIRMYSEMLREGWADEARKRSYYDFIHDESERLSRLITNVLQLARMGRDELRVEPRPVDVAQLINMARSKVSTQIERAGFELRVNCTEAALNTEIEVDDDALVQVFINLADNAVKFSSKADRKTIELGCELLSDHRIQFSIRDYGPGIQKSQLKKIFLLFYRPENELTRETVGTGIGLALVHRLVTAMQGEVDVINREPGAEFRITFPVNRG